MSKNLALALHMGESPFSLPSNPPTAIGEILVIKDVPAGGNIATSEWIDPGNLGSGGGGSPLPTPTDEGQIIVAGAAPGFIWGASDLIDAGRY